MSLPLIQIKLKLHFFPRSAYHSRKEHKLKCHQKLVVLELLLMFLLILRIPPVSQYLV